MSESIFEFGDKFGIESPFGNWLPTKIEFSNISFELIEKVNADRSITQSIKIKFSINSEISDSNARTTLRTTELPANALELPVNGKLTPLRVGINNFEITLNKTAYNNHLRSVGAGTLLFHFTLVSGNRTIKSDDFVIKSYAFKVTKISQDLAHKIIEFKIDSVGMINEMINIQAYQKTQNGYQLIEGLNKKIQLNITSYTGTFKIKKTTIESRLTTNNNSIYLLEISNPLSNSRTSELDLKIEDVNKKITAEQIQKIIPTTTLARINLFLDGINQALEDNEISSDLQISHFLAQIFHESANLQYTKELGATESSYQGFYGRGLIQITSKANYQEYEDFCGEDVTSTLANRNKLAEPFHAAKSAGWWWGASNYNDLAENNDIITISKKINGGFNGYNDRVALFKKAFFVLTGNQGSEILFKNSSAYTIDKSCFAWGLWHDPGINEGQFETCANNKARAIEGYERFLTLIGNDNGEFGWNRINTLSVFSAIKVVNEVKQDGSKTYHVNVKKAAKLRLNALKQ